MIVYRKVGHLRIQRRAFPEPPWWAATIIAPYSARRAAPIAVDYLELRASCADRFDVTVCDNVLDELERATERAPVREPALIDAAEFAEVVFRRGEEALQFVSGGGGAAIHLVSAHGALPVNADGATVAVAAWPLDLDRLQPLFDEAQTRRLHWGVAVPVMYPVTTNLTALAELADAAQQRGASFFAALPVDLDPTARKAIADSLAVNRDDESYDMLFHADLEPIHVATERHVAALAAEIGADDFIVPPRWERRSNWNAAVLLTLAATRMLAMRQEVETAWRIIRSARLVALLDKPIERVAAAANLSIIEGLDPISVEALTEWLESGRSSFVDHVNKQWRLRRDSGM